MVTEECVNTDDCMATNRSGSDTECNKTGCRQKSSNNICIVVLCEPEVGRIAATDRGKCTLKKNFCVIFQINVVPIYLMAWCLYVIDKSFQTKILWEPKTSLVDLTKNRQSPSMLLPNAEKFCVAFCWNMRSIYAKKVRNETSVWKLILQGGRCSYINWRHICRRR